jgi:hypothetical protein
MTRQRVEDLRGAAASGPRLDLRGPMVEARTRAGSLSWLFRRRRARVAYRRT